MGADICGSSPESLSSHHHVVWYRFPEASVDKSAQCPYAALWAEGAVVSIETRVTISYIEGACRARERIVSGRELAQGLPLPAVADAADGGSP